MNGLLRFIRGINLMWAFLILFAAHGLLYFGLGNGNWFLLALSAALVWTGLFTFAKLFALRRRRSK